MDDELKEVTFMGCGTCFGVLAIGLAFWAAFVYGVILIIQAISG